MRETSAGAGGAAVPPGKGSRMEFPACLKCDEGLLLPLSDYGRDGAAIRYKAWVCNNPECGYTIRIDNGDISTGRLKS